MTETTMPAAEAEAVVVDERQSYELAFHVLPTVAEGEVTSVFDTIKAHLTKAGADIFDEEAPERFDLAYEIVKHYEGKNRRFTSAYFGWIRFKAPTDAVATVAESVEENSSILRHILIKLTKTEEENPFRFHEVMQSQKMVTDVAEVLEEAEAEGSAESSMEAEKPEITDEAAIDEALDKSEV